MNFWANAGAGCLLFGVAGDEPADSIVARDDCCDAGERGQGMSKLDHATPSTWSESYRGHWIEASGCRSGWRAVLDAEPSGSREFETAQEALAWLRRQIDCQIAEAVFPGLAGP